MAVYNEILVGRYNRFLQKLLGIKGGPPAASLAGDVMAGISFFHGAESLYHQGWETFGASDSIVAVAANFSKMKIRNPAGSNVMAVITKLVVNPGAASTIQVRLQTPETAADFGGVIFPFSFERARGARNRATSIPSDQNSDAVFITGTIIAQITVPLNVPLELIATDVHELVLPPNTELQVACNVVNQALNFTIWWRERFLEETERT